jgi:hypothetical protein
VQNRTPNVYLTIEYTELKDGDDVVHEGGANDATRWTERPKFAESTVLPPTDGSVILLARIVLKPDGDNPIDTIDTDIAQKAAVSVVAPEAIREAQLAGNSVTFDKLAKDSVQGDRIKDGAVTTGKLAAGSVGGPDPSPGLAVLADRGITASKLAVGSIGGGTGTPGLGVLADGGITHDKLAPDAVQGDKIRNNTITGDKLVNGSVGFAALAITQTRDTTFNNVTPGQVVTATLTVNTTVPQFLFYGVTITSGNGASLAFVPWPNAPTGQPTTTVLMDASGNGDVTYSVFLKNITGGNVSGFVRMRTIAMS